MDQNTLTGVITALLQQAGRAVERGAELAPQALEAAGRYLQFLAIAQIMIGLFFAVLTAVAIYCFKKGFDMQIAAQSKYRQPEEESTDDYYTRKSKKESEEIKALITIVVSCIAATVFALASVLHVAEPRTWASALDHRAALVGYALDAAKSNNRR